MRRRLDLAAGLVVAPEILFLDEPTTGLDPRSRAAMWDVISALAGAGTTVFLTTQYLEEADRLADRIAVVDDGRVVAEGTPASSRRASADRAWTSASRRPALALPTDGDAAAVRTLWTSSIPAATGRRFAVREATLDDVFLSLTAHRPEGHPCLTRSSCRRAARACRAATSRR